MRRPGIHHRDNHVHTPFGGDSFGVLAERFARFFGTPKFIIGQTLIVLAWITVNIIVLALQWDPYPFILLNLAFSTQAAYAAPLILLAQTRQADRDKARTIADLEHREQIAAEHKAMLQQVQVLLEQNTELTAQVRASLED